VTKRDSFAREQHNATLVQQYGMLGGFVWIQTFEANALVLLLMNIRQELSRDCMKSAYIRHYQSCIAGPSKVSGAAWLCPRSLTLPEKELFPHQHSDHEGWSGKFLFSGT